MKKIFIPLLLIGLISPLYSASVHGALKGTVTDTQGNPIPDVKITITNLQYTNVNFTLKSNKKGEFFQIGLQPGYYYQIKGEKDGYFPVVFEKRVGISDTVDATFAMEEGKFYVEESPGNEDFELGNDWFAQGNFEEAAKAYEKAIDKEPEEPIYYNNLGIVYTNLQKYDEAIGVYKKMLEVQPGSYSANKNLGELYGLKKEYREAVPYFSEAVELSPDDPDAYYNLGACLMNTGANSDALEAFSKTTELKPDHALAHYQVGMIYVNQNKKEEAIKNLEKFLELAPSDPNAPIAKKIIEYLKSMDD